MPTIAGAGTVVLRSAAAAAAIAPAAAEQPKPPPDSVPVIETDEDGHAVGGVSIIRIYICV